MIESKHAILAAFRCHRTGHCCQAGGYVRVSNQDIERMAQHVGLLVSEFKHQYVVIKSGWAYVATPTHRPRCFLDDANRCQVYEVRPLACRTYPDWPSIWESDAALTQEMTQCKGLREAVHRVVS